jgi:Rrf2 family transcriptional regulator, cysteine metabolism repressor
MKISTKGRYASRVMLDLALNDTGEPIRLKDIAKRQEISEKYLEQIISILNRAGYVKSIRGAHGGYRLSKKPEEYTIGMILRLTEGSLAPVECMGENASTCDRKSGCATVVVWEKLYEAINSVIDNITLADLVDIENNKNANDFVI